VPDGDVDRLASADISTQRSPLRAAHDLDTQLQHRDLLRQQRGSAQAPASPASAAAPLVQPAPAAETRPAGPEQQR